MYKTNQFIFTSAFSVSKGTGIVDRLFQSALKKPSPLQGRLSIISGSSAFFRFTRTLLKYMSLTFPFSSPPTKQPFSEVAVMLLK